MRKPDRKALLGLLQCPKILLTCFRARISGRDICESDKQVSRLRRRRSAFSPDSERRTDNEKTSKTFCEGFLVPGS